jgi:hypothetical protein
MRSVPGIDTEDHRADPGGSELNRKPLEAIRQPDGDHITAAHPEPTELPGQVPRTDVEFPVGQRPWLACAWLDNRKLIRVPAHRLCQQAGEFRRGSRF